MNEVPCRCRHHWGWDVFEFVLDILLLWWVLK